MFNDFHITIDSFGQECPKNWEEIADYMNQQIDELDDFEDKRDLRDAIDEIWENYWSAYHSGTLPNDAPIPTIN